MGKSARAKAIDYRADYEEHLMRYNRRLADAMSEHGRLEAARDEARAAYRKDQERYVTVMNEFVLLIAQRQTSIDECEVLKSQLISQVAANRATMDDLYERRCAQYERALDDLESKNAFFKSKLKGMFDKNNKRIALVGEIALTTDTIRDRKVLGTYDKIDEYDHGDLWIRKSL